MAVARWRRDRLLHEPTGRAADPHRTSRDRWRGLRQIGRLPGARLVPRPEERRFGSRKKVRHGPRSFAAPIDRLGLAGSIFLTGEAAPSVLVGSLNLAADPNRRLETIGVTLQAGDPKDPERHPIAIALRRTHGVDDARVTKRETLIRRGKKWFRYDAPDKRLFKELQKTLTGR